MAQPDSAWPGVDPLKVQSPFPAHLRASLPMNPERLTVDMSMTLIKRMINELQGRGVLHPTLHITTQEDQHALTIRVEVND